MKISGIGKAFLFSFCSGMIALAGNVYAGPTGGTAISMNAEGCQAVSEAREALKWTYIDKKTYTACESDGDCAVSGEIGPCGGIINKGAAEILRTQFAKSCEYSRLQELQTSYLCPIPACAPLGVPRCENGICLPLVSGR